MKLIRFLLHAAPIKVAIAVVAGLLAGVSNTGLLILINTSWSARGSSSVSLIRSFIGLCLLMLMARTVSSMVLTYLARRAVFDLRLRLCQQILAAPLRLLEDVGTPRLLASLTEDSPVIAVTMVSLPILCMHLTVVATCLIYLCWLSLPVFLCVMGFLVFGALSYRLPFARGLKYVSIARTEWDTLLKHFRALTEGAKELKLHDRRREVFVSEDLTFTAAALRRHGYMSDVAYAVAGAWGQLLVFGLIGLLLFGLPALTTVDIRILASYSLIIIYMMAPLEYIMNTLPQMGRASVAIEKIEELGRALRDSSDEALATRPVAPLLEYDSLEMVGVTHAYYREDKQSSFLLGPIDLCFQPSELVFLIGGNGSGKTTLIKLLAGLYVPEAGDIRLNGRVINEENRGHYRQLFSAVFSDFFLFEQLHGLDLADLDAQARQYLSKLQLEHKVQIKDGVLSTTALSQGQRKRLALMTAYLENRSFYIFDEWAADQDPLFKEVFYLQLLPELKARGKTILVISHDDRYYHVADRIIKLDYGKIVYNESPDRSRNFDAVIVEDSNQAS